MCPSDSIDPDEAALRARVAAYRKATIPHHQAILDRKLRLLSRLEPLKRKSFLALLASIGNLSIGHKKAARRHLLSFVAAHNRVGELKEFIQDLRELIDNS